MNILQKIFKEYFEEIEYILHPRPVVMENIEKMIDCGNPSYGGAMYGCSHCGELKFIPFRCHSKFCPTCGLSFWVAAPLLDCLFRAVRSVILRLFHNMNKSRNFVPGFVCVLHTFGRPLEWNPHIHCLLTEGGFSDDGFWKVVKHFSYTYLRKAFQTALLNEMELHIGPSFKKTKAAIYKKDKNGFYVYAKPTLCGTDSVIKYISRYLGRPVIATSRIDSYDGDNVTFHYNKHEDDSYVEKTVPVLDFISLLIQHIPEKHFKMTRYYGLYARHRGSDEKLRRAVPKSKRRILLDFNKWRQLTLLSFGYDPLQCPKCNHKMEFPELYHKHKPVSLEKLYERAMAKYHCRSSGKSA